MAAGRKGGAMRERMRKDFPHSDETILSHALAHENKRAAEGRDGSEGALGDRARGRWDEREFMGAKETREMRMNANHRRGSGESKGEEDFFLGRGRGELERE